MLIRAAGAVVWRPGPDGDQVLLVHRGKYDDWSLPKGKQEPDEPLPLTAVREVLEESGASVTLGRHLAPVRYKVNGHPKQVDFWVAALTGLDATAVPNGEVDEIAWLPVPEALRRVSYKQDVAVLLDFASGFTEAVPLVLLRHARALPRSEWKHPDADRPLDKAGTADAALLASLLACFAPTATVTSSDTVRCLDTVGPYAELTGSPVRASAALRAARAGNKPAPADLLFALTAAREPAIVCAHRENLPALLSSALRFLGDPAVPEKVAKPLPKGAFLVLHATGGTLAGIDRYELPDLSCASRLAAHQARLADGALLRGSFPRFRFSFLVARAQSTRRCAPSACCSVSACWAPSDCWAAVACSVSGAGLSADRARRRFLRCRAPQAPATTTTAMAR
jgi:8-oxo-dGTP pyrophosphatase MutT (NUDIX family)/phosphohistidine phosphatase SixA